MEQTIPPANDGAYPLVTRLSPSAMHRKLLMLACFRTQRAVVQEYSAPIEGFRRAAGRDFTRPPYAGQLGYEVTRSGLEAALWRELMARYEVADRGIASHGPRGFMLRTLYRLLIASTGLRRRYCGKAERIERIMARLVLPRSS